MIHGEKDEVVPLNFHEWFYQYLKSLKKLVVIKKGDHSLSNPSQLKIIRELKEIIKNVI